MVQIGGIMKQLFNCEVVSKTFLNEDVYTLRLKRPQQMGDIRPSQFFNLHTKAMPYLKRPISISNFDEETFDFTIIIKGEGTKILSEVKPGDLVEVQGPLGNTYTIDPEHKKVLVIGGGIGVPPQAVLSEALKRDTDAHITVQLGFRNEAYLVERFDGVADVLQIASENVDYDHKGYVTDLTAKALEENDFDMVYVCGPHILIEKVAKMCMTKNVPVQLLMEERMACGIGACMVCTCKVKDDTMPEGYWNKRVCKDGPVFWGSEVLFDA